MLHPLLLRQLRKLGLSSEAAPATTELWMSLLERVSAAYAGSDQDRYTLERSLSISSKEMQDLYEDLRVRSQSELAYSERVLKAVLESVPDGIIVADETGKFLVWNAAAEAIIRMGPTDLPPEAWPRQYGLYEPDTVTPLAAHEFPLVKAMRGEIVDRMECFVRHALAPDGIWLSIHARPLKEDSGAIRGGVAVLRDITLEKAAQTQLIMSDRMVSVGLLAAGVAHEINNPLTAIIANLDLAVMEVAARADVLGPTPGELKDELQEAREAAERVRNIVRDLKIFSRVEEEKLGPVDVQRVLESSLRMAWTEIRHRARLVKEYGEVPTVDANESRLGQVFLNLVINAAQSIPEGRATTNQIRVSTYTDARGRVVVEITDTGAGIAAETLPRLFTPFYTTKPVGVGTGLGLSICHRLVTAIGGEIAVESTVGKGTTFRVALPASSAKDATQLRQTPAPAPARRVRILVVDDEINILKAVRRTLSGEHDVTTASSAREAMERIVNGERFEIVLCDLMMPEVTGMEFHGELLGRAPEQAKCVIFLTGGAFTPAARAYLAKAGNTTIDKPFDARNLRALINERVGSRLR
jgi:signal transduction histidine kinase/ActR/RegA family two-component response regulator